MMVGDAIDECGICVHGFHPKVDTICALLLFWGDWGVLFWAVKGCVVISDHGLWCRGF